MQALRVIQDVAQDGCLHVKIPAGMGTRFELIVLPLGDEIQPETHAEMQLQELGGFVKTVIASPEEDIWNDL
jgi:hypothetical protein